MSDTHKYVRGESIYQNIACETLADSILTRIGDKWTIKVVITLTRGPLRYKQIFRQMDGISQRMLTLTLKNLERDGLISRTVYPTNPPQVDYALTERGWTLIEPLQALLTWVEGNYTEIAESRHKYDDQQQRVHSYQAQ